MNDSPSVRPNSLLVSFDPPHPPFPTSRSLVFLAQSYGPVDLLISPPDLAICDPLPSPLPIFLPSHSPFRLFQLTPSFLLRTQSARPAPPLLVISKSFFPVLNSSSYRPLISNVPTGVSFLSCFDSRPVLGDSFSPSCPLRIRRFCLSRVLLFFCKHFW